MEKARATYDAQLLYAEEKGEKRGEEIGLSKGEENFAILIKCLTEANRADEIALCANDAKYRKERMEEFRIR